MINKDITSKMETDMMTKDVAKKERQTMNKDIVSKREKHDEQCCCQQK